MARRKRISSSLFRKMAQRLGLPPGTPVHVGEKKTEKVVVRVVFYDAEGAELKWPWGYPAAPGLMAMISPFMLWYFNRKGWL